MSRDPVARIVALGYTEAEALGRLASAEMVVAIAPDLAARSLAAYQAEAEKLRTAHETAHGGPDAR